MNCAKIIAAISFSAACFGLAHAQAPSITVDPSRHGNLASAQESVAQAYGRISEAQRDNSAHLGGHAQRAKDFLTQANQEIGLAASQSDANQSEAVSSAPPLSQPVAPPAMTGANISGNWTIYAYNVSQPGSSLKEIQISQDGNIVSGTFHGPHQKGHLQGWINGNHVEFSTDTRDVLTFRGEVTPEGMSGMYGIHGEHAPWKAQRN
ncbi:hypothetical protein [Terriglobus sp.]|uniref:hypothetical protein n=1 Tax=Terriglobus sp. TaxID=1889013 RepID=UPI003B0048F0